MKTKSFFSMSTIFGVLGLASLALGIMPSVASAAATDRVNNVVLVHGAFADGGGWEPVYQLLKSEGYHVSIVQNPTTSLAADLAATKAVIDAQDGPVVLVGHSYGGIVISEAGNDPKVARLVYIAAFAAENGESVQKLIAHPVPGAPVPPILPPVNGFLTLDKAKFPAAFAGDVNAQRAAFLADAQLPWGLEALTGEVTNAAWHTKPSWYLVTKDDKMIPPDAQRVMAKRANATVTEVAASHAVYESHPADVAAIIESAATSK